jgi:hypothetical protein
MYARRHAIRFATYAFAVAALLSRRRWPLVVAAVGGALYAATPLRRAWRRLPPESPRRWAALAGVPTMMAFIDAAKMRGYLRGLLGGRRAPR